MHWKKANVLRAKRYWNASARRKQAKLLEHVRRMPGYHEKLARAMRRYYKNPEARGRIDRLITSWWRNHPNIRKINSDKMKREFAKHPEALKKFMKGGKNPFKARLKTNQGFLVRSKGEREIANFLFENRIKSQYEAKTLQLDGNLCTPDFFLVKEKIYIEYYGGHPKAWKKKVLKNKLYKKYKIKCIFITPGELENLSYYLLGEIGKLSARRQARF